MNQAQSTTVIVEEAQTFSDFIKASKAAILVRGIVFLLLGIMMFFRPVQTIAVFVMLLGIYVLIEGGVLLFAAFKLHRDARAVLLLNSVILILLGIAAIIMPWRMGEYAIIFFGVWQLISGLQCLFVPAARNTTVASGIIALLAGCFLIMAPFIGLLTFAWIFAVLFIITGIFMLVTGFKLKAR